MKTAHARVVDSRMVHMALCRWLRYSGAGPGIRRTGADVVDLRAGVGALPRDAGLFPDVPSGTLVATAGLAFDAGAHVYLIRLGPARVGIGAASRACQARRRRSRRRAVLLRRSRCPRFRHGSRPSRPSCLSTSAPLRGGATSVQESGRRRCAQQPQPSQPAAAMAAVTTKMLR